MCFTQQMKIIINCGKSDILKSKQVDSLAKRIFNKFSHCLQSSPPASTRSLQLPFVWKWNSSAHFSFSFFTLVVYEIFLLRRSFSIAPATELLKPKTSDHPSTVTSVAFMKTSVHVLFVICFSLHFKLDSLGSNSVLSDRNVSARPN